MTKKFNANDIVGNISKSILTDKVNVCKIGGQEVNVIFDTGATYNFISKSIIKKLGLKTHRNNRKLFFSLALKKNLVFLNIRLLTFYIKIFIIR